MSPDPIGYGDRLNFHAYVGNDPVNASDPSGTKLYPGGSGGATSQYALVEGSSFSGLSGIFRSRFDISNQGEPSNFSGGVSFRLAACGGDCGPMTDYGGSAFIEGYTSYFTGLGRCASGSCDSAAGSAASSVFINQMNDPECRKFALEAAVDMLVRKPNRIAGRFVANIVHTGVGSFVGGMVGFAVAQAANAASTRGDIEFFADALAQSGEQLSSHELIGIVLGGGSD